MNRKYGRMTLLTLLIGVLVVALLGEGVLAGDFPTSRDPVLWPFAWDSIWNMPIGSDAVYVDAEIGASESMGMTVDEDILILEPTAPLKYVYYNDAGWDQSKTRCGCVYPDQYVFPDPVPVPDDFRTDPGYLGLTPNHSAAILLSDGLTIRQTQPLHVCNYGGTVTSQYGPPDFPDDHIKTGDGIQGAHGGSGMSSMGGAVRVGELVPGGVIRHALKINVYASKYLYYKKQDPTPGYRWPAVQADGYAGSRTSPCAYGGSLPAMEMGALVALKPDFNINLLRTEPARILAQVFKDYGAYIVDDTCWDVYGMATEWGPDGRVIDEFQQEWGFPMQTGVLATCTDLTNDECKWARDMADIFANLHVIDNNGPDSIGGGGAPRQPYAPPFIGEPTATPWPTDTPGPTDTPFPTATPIPTATPTPSSGYYAENFNDGQAQDWVLTLAYVTGGVLQVDNWDGVSQAIYDGQTFSADYTFEVDVTTSAGSNNNKARIFFNYSDDSNYYYLVIGGGDKSNTIELKKKVGGAETTLGTYRRYFIKDVWVTFEIQYTAGGYITVTATKDGAPTTLFDGVQDSSLTSGKIGVGGNWMVASYDNVEVNY